MTINKQKKLSLAEKMAFIDNVANAVVQEDGTYTPIIKQIYIDMMTLKYYTDFDFGENENGELNLADVADKIDSINKTEMINLRSVVDACVIKSIDDKIEYLLAKQINKSATPNTDELLFMLLANINDVITKLGEKVEGLDLTGATNLMQKIANDKDNIAKTVLESAVKAGDESKIGIVK